MGLPAKVGKRRGPTDGGRGPPGAADNGLLSVASSESACGAVGPAMREAAPLSAASDKGISA